MLYSTIESQKPCAVLAVSSEGGWACAYEEILHDILARERRSMSAQAVWNCYEVESAHGLGRDVRLCPVLT